MGAAIRETGSILVRAPRDRVFEALRHRLAAEPGVRALDGARLEAERGDRRTTYVLRDAPDGTRVILARTEPALRGLFAGPREELRTAVQAELFQVQRLLGADRP